MLVCLLLAIGADVLKAPFPWFGGKSRASHLVWRGFGDVPNYVEPFAGSLAALLGRPHEARIETVNDLDCYLANFWRAVKWAPELVAEHADWPVNEADLHARHRDLVTRVEFRRRMKREPKFFDAELAGWWVWGLCQWIGSGWCSDANWDDTRPRLRGSLAETDTSRPNMTPMGVHRRQVTSRAEKRPVLKRGGLGVHRRLSRNLNSAEWEKRPNLGEGGKGVHRTRLSEQMPMLSGDSGASGRGIHASGRSLPLIAWMQALAERLRRVRVCCGDWKRVLGPSVTTHIGATGVFLDPPYLATVRSPDLYATEGADVAHAVREWAIEHGSDPKLRIALCGYEGEHVMPATWECVEWKAVGGYAAAAGNTENASRERIWFSPHCELVELQGDLFATTGRVA